MTAVRDVRTVRAELESPFVSQGLWANAPGLDTVLVRNHEDRLIIPGSQLQGLLRAVLGAMLDKGALKFTEAHLGQWFGQGSGDAYGSSVDGLDNPFEPDKGRVRCGDLVCQASDEAQGPAQTRIKIEDQTGSVAEGALQVLELPFPLGKTVPFAGEMTFWGPVDQASLFWEVAGLALGFLPALGAIKSAGFGNLAQPLALISPDHPPTQAVDFSPADTLAIDERMAFELEFKEPFVVDAELIGGNIYEGNRIIPGAVIKACLVRKLELAGEFDEALAATLSEVLVSHAFPVAAGVPASSRPRTIPCSLVQCDKKNVPGDGYAEDLYDCFWEPDLPAWRDGLLTYAVDWKGSTWDAAKTQMGWNEEIGYHVRTRTAIKSESGVVEKGKLFSYREVIPAGLTWRFLVDRGQVGEAAFRKIVCALLAGLDFVGKTDARADCRQVVDACTEAAPASADYHGQSTWRITLQTPALMLDTAAAIRQPDQEEPPSLKELYAVYWQDLIKDAWSQAPPAPTVTLVDFRATQKWEGGYRARRFRQQKGRYTPYLLTQAGAVFLLTLEGAPSEEQQAFFAKLVKRGLPALFQGEIRHSAPELWKQCPYTPENGYGEVRADWADARRFGGGVRLA